MPASPKPVPVDERMKAALVMVSESYIAEMATRRYSALEILADRAPRLAADSELWPALGALLSLDEDGMEFGLGILDDFHARISLLLVALADVLGTRSEGAVKWETMRRAKDDIEALTALFPQLEDAIAEIEVPS